MQLPPKDPPKKQSLDKPAQQFRGFKPLISIPIIVSTPNSNEKPMSTLKDPNLSLDVRLNATYQQYLRLVKQNRLIKTTIQHVKKERNQLQWKLRSLQAIDNDDADSKKKRHRRNASQIVRSYVCPIQNCDKSYGAQASLAQHIKLKHESYYGTPQYQSYIQELNKRAQNKQQN